MTTKFSKNRDRQKPPAVCRKPPPPLDVDPPIWRVWPPDGSLRLDTWVYSDHLIFFGNFRMRPGGPPNTFTAQSSTGKYTIDTSIINNPATGLQTAMVAVLIGASVEQVATLPNFKPRSMQPYDSGILAFGPPGMDNTVRLRIMS